VPSGLWFVLSGGTGRAAGVVTGVAVPPNALPSSPTAFRRVYFVRRDALTLSALGTRQGRTQFSREE